MSKNGKIVQVIGAVVDAAFPIDSVPEIFDAIIINYQVGGAEKSLTLEVQQHLGDGWVRAVAMSSTEGLVRGMEVIDTGDPSLSLSVKASSAVSLTSLVTPWTKKVPWHRRATLSIHRTPPSLIDQRPTLRSLRLASRSSTSFARSPRVVRLAPSVVPVWARPLSSWSSSITSLRRTVVTPYSLVWVSALVRVMTFTTKCRCRRYRPGKHRATPKWPSSTAR